MWQLIALNFFYQTGIYGYTLWLPTILKELTHSSMGQVGMLAILPYVGAIAGMFLFSSLSDRTGKRKLFVCLPLIGFALCMFLSVALKNNVWLAYAALVGCGFFLQSAAGVFWTIPARLFSAEMAGGARGHQRAGQPRRLLRPLCGRRTHHPVQQRCGRLLPGYLTGSGRADGAAAASEMRCRCRSAKDTEST
jgi:MFS family permease